MYDMSRRIVKITTYNYFQEETNYVTKWISRSKVELSGAAKFFGFISKWIAKQMSRSSLKKFKKHAERFYAHQMKVESRMGK